MLKNVLGFHRIRVERRHGAARRHRRGRGGHDARANSSTCSAPPAIRACRSTARRSTIPRAWSTSATSSTSSPPRADDRAARRRAGRREHRRGGPEPRPGRPLRDASPRPRSCGRCCSCRARCRRSIFWSGCRRRAPIWRSSSTNMAAPTASSRSRTSSRWWSATSRTSTTTPRRRMIVAEAATDLRRRRPREPRRGVGGLGVDLDDEVGAEDIDTLGGFIVTLAGRVPSRGELIAGPGASNSRCSTPIRAG